MSLHPSLILVDVPVHMEKWRKARIASANKCFSSNGLILNSWSTDCSLKIQFFRRQIRNPCFYITILKWLITIINIAVNDSVSMAPE